jgi:hypothetical protein
MYYHLLINILTVSIQENNEFREPGRICGVKVERFQQIVPCPILHMHPCILAQNMRLERIEGIKIY